MIRHARWIALLALGASTSASAQYSIQVEGPGRAKATVIVRRALADSHDIMFADSGRRVILPRGTEVPRTVLVLGGDVSVGATVRGDVIVVGGDLFLSPGASIDGRTVAIGGGVYGSTLASVRGGTESLRDHTFLISRSPNSARLDYRYIGGGDPGFELPLLEGLRIPSYDRIDGASLAWGPILRPTARWVVDPTVTYRSHLGAWDPGLNAVFKLGERYNLSIDARRGTFTNDAWIYPDILNSINTLVRGSDMRNYYRADRGELEIRRFDEYVTPKLELERFFGVATERAWSAARDTLGTRPWSLTGRNEADEMARANPGIERGRISSAFVGAMARYQVGDVRMSGTGRVEVPFASPRDERFAQVTFDGTIAFPTFGVQRFRSDLHVVATVGDSAPPQRYAYLGGSGTLPILEDEPLAFGGDQLVHLDSRYEVPIPRLKLPFLGSPTVSLRHRIGSAGVQRLPRFIQNVGPRVTLSFVRVEYTIDPATNDSRFAVGLSFAR